MEPNDANAYHNRGVAIDNLGRSKDAEADYAKAREIDSKSGGRIMFQRSA
jgi:Flp pilus assembly protein TadD